MGGRRRTLVLVVVLLLAGCGAGGSGEQNTLAPDLEGTPSPSPTASPTPSPSPTPTPTFEQRLPPGVSPESADALRLAGAHRGELVSFSRTTVRRVTYTTSNTTVLGDATYRTETELLGSRSRVLVTSNVSGEAPAQVGLTTANATYWGNETVSVSRQISPDGPEYGFNNGPLPPVIRADTTGRGTVFLAFSSVNVTSVEFVGVVDGRERFRIVGSAARAPTVRGQNVTLTAVVSEIGIVHRLRFAYTTERGDESVRVVQRFRVEDFKNTTAPPPDWFTTAREREQ